MNKVFAGVVAVAAGLALAGCGGKPAGGGDPYAGLDDAIRAWKTDLSAGDASCRSAPAGAKCEMFEVSCKAQRNITPPETSQGVSAKLVAHMTWSGFDERGGEEPHSAAAQFVKVNGTWTRSAVKAVNPETCADQ
ncbi:hypothetical protein [Phenylobacterium soli]|uniref:Lipoprotein n=1 Tax=Phenylobacterium soli TaxID=2170551 RepID=A0A328AAS0_9CAUL|nr:hypothetical protein [Phenylobacterium soli]RAK51853.1 hypothetical protein DJ017_18735 [Phenylobacterium soli]